MSMEQKDTLEILENTHIIPLHFNVPKHYLALEDFIVSAISTEMIVEDFNQQFFGGKLKYKIIVLPPEPGTFKERLGIKITTAGVAFLLGSMSPEFMSGMVKGVTGKSVFELGEIAGESIVDLSEATQKAWGVNLAGVFLAEATKGFFQKEEFETQSSR